MLPLLGEPKACVPRHRSVDVVDAHTPHIVGDSASERFDASDVFNPLIEQHEGIHTSSVAAG